MRDAFIWRTIRVSEFVILNFLYRCLYTISNEQLKYCKQKKKEIRNVTVVLPKLQSIYSIKLIFSTDLHYLVHKVQLTVPQFHNPCTQSELIAASFRKVC